MSQAAAMGALGLDESQQVSSSICLLGFRLPVARARAKLPSRPPPAYDVLRLFQQELAQWMEAQKGQMNLQEAISTQTSTCWDKYVMSRPFASCRPV